MSSFSAWDSNTCIFCKLSGQNRLTGGFPALVLALFLTEEVDTVFGADCEAAAAGKKDLLAAEASSIGCKILLLALMNQLLTCNKDRFVWWAISRFSSSLG